MTVLPPGLIALPDVPSIVDQAAPLRPAPRDRRSPAWAVAFVALVILTIAAGASALHDRAPGDPTPSAPTTASVEVAPAADIAAPPA